jgi:hypothetical protein
MRGTTPHGETKFSGFEGSQNSPSCPSAKGNESEDFRMVRSSGFRYKRPRNSYSGLMVKFKFMDPVRTSQ